MTHYKLILRPALLALALFASAAQASLVPPQGYYEGIEKLKTGTGDFRCEAPPTPYTGALQFRSKYEGSDKARATLNVASEHAFRTSTQDIISSSVSALQVRGKGRAWMVKVKSPSSSIVT